MAASAAAAADSSCCSSSNGGLGGGRGRQLVLLLQPAAVADLGLGSRVPPLPPLLPALQPSLPGCLGERRLRGGSGAARGGSGACGALVAAGHGDLRQKLDSAAGACPGSLVVGPRSRRGRRLQVPWLGVELEAAPAELRQRLLSTSSMLFVRVVLRVVGHACQASQGLPRGREALQLLVRLSEVVVAALDFVHLRFEFRDLRVGGVQHFGHGGGVVGALALEPWRVVVGRRAVLCALRADLRSEAPLLLLVREILLQARLQGVTYRRNAVLARGLLRRVRLRRVAYRRKAVLRREPALARHVPVREAVPRVAPRHRP
mmetsp:Transcript_114172/g.355537  ORF Transcript_114172/g.355537 Transcript_114172/m.355537 type:complete len:318 (-) Transcript_114172:845-1798(-)